MHKYLAFCYSGDAEQRYEIVFGWGRYDIYTTGRQNSRPEGLGARYRGYIVARPSRIRDTEGRPLWIYVVTPGGEAWRRKADENMPIPGRRKYGVGLRPRAGSPVEPVIDDLLTHPEAWQRYGTLKAEAYGGYRLERIVADPSD